MYFTEWNLRTTTPVSTTTEPAPTTTVTDSTPITTITDATTQQSFGSETTAQSFSETTFKFLENNSGDFRTDVVVPCVIGAILVGAIIIIILWFSWKNHKRIQGEKTKGCQVTEKSEDNPPLGTLLYGYI